MFVFAGTKYNIFARVAAVQPAPATAVLCVFINLGDCGRVLNIGSQKIYLRSDKKTDRALHVGINGDVFYGNMSTSIDGPLKINYNGTTYSVYDDSME